MDERDVEMEDAGKLLEDEVVGGEECVEKNQLDEKEAGDKQQESFDVQSPNEIVTEQEKPSKEDKSEEESPVDETQVNEKDTKSMDDDDKVHEGNKDATTMDDDKAHDGNKDDDNGVVDEADHDHDALMNMQENNNEGDEKHQELVTPTTLVIQSPSKAEDHSVVTLKNELEDTKVISH